MDTLLDAIYKDGSNLYNYLEQLYVLDVNGEKNSKKFEEINIKYRDLVISLNQKLYELSKAGITGIDLKKYFLKKTEFNVYPKGFTVPFLIGIDTNLIENYIFNTSFLLFELDFNDKNGYNDDSCIKNNRDLLSWQIIDKLGLRGYQIGGAKVNEKHANFLVNESDATFLDMIALLELIVYEAKKQLDEPVISFIGIFIPKLIYLPVPKGISSPPYMKLSPSR